MENMALEKQPLYGLEKHVIYYELHFENQIDIFH